ncbi:MAG: hypothetical protein ABR499_12930 [Gemmatimonadaceae bacterium]
MRSINRRRFCRALAEPTLYADAPLARVLTAVDRGAPDLDGALAAYARARRVAGVRPERVIVELKRVLRRAVGLDLMHPLSTLVGGREGALAGRLTHRLIELYFAA